MPSTHCLNTNSTPGLLTTYFNLLFVIAFLHSLSIYFIDGIVNTDLVMNLEGRLSIQGAVGQPLEIPCDSSSVRFDPHDLEARRGFTTYSWRVKSIDGEEFIYDLRISDTEHGTYVQARRVVDRFTGMRMVLYLLLSSFVSSRVLGRWGNWPTEFLLQRFSGCVVRRLST